MRVSAPHPLIGVVLSTFKQTLLAAGGVVLFTFESLALRFVGSAMVILAVWWVCDDLTRAERSRENIRACRNLLVASRARRLAKQIETSIPALIPTTARGRTPHKAAARRLFP